MKHLNKFILLAMIAFLTSSCLKDDDDEEIPDPQNREVIEVSGNITTNTTWEESKKYLLKGFVYVKAGATLTVQAGTIIKGDKPTKGSLIIEPGAKIIADGTSDKPIIFTSNVEAGSRNSGDWGGIILLGKAKTNKATPTVEGENTTTYGGTDDNDNSGILRYVRIEFAGIAYETDKEINGLTLGGVGSGTTIDYVQVSYSGDDGFEWFGGNVNAKHLISYKTLDDDFDTDYGFSGKVQYALALRDPGIADQCSCSDSNGFESDNDASGSTDAPQTSASFANVSILIGPGTVNSKYRSAFRIRRNSAVSIYNTLVVGDFPKASLELEGTASQGNFTSGKSDYRGLVLVTSKPVLNVDPTLFTDASRANVTTATVNDLKLDASFNTISGTPNFLPQAGSPLLSGGATLASGFEANTFKGAFSTNNWTQGWTNWNPQNTTY